jgi:hypothetical protein
MARIAARCCGRSAAPFSVWGRWEPQRSRGSARAGAARASGAPPRRPVRPAPPASAATRRAAAWPTAAPTGSAVHALGIAPGAAWRGTACRGRVSLPAAAPVRRRRLSATTRSASPAVRCAVPACASPRSRATPSARRGLPSHATRRVAAMRTVRQLPRSVRPACFSRTTGRLRVDRRLHQARASVSDWVSLVLDDAVIVHR